MIKDLYVAVRNLIIALLTIATLTLFFFSSKLTLPYLAQTYLHNYGITYSKIKGSIATGFIIKDVSYKNSIKIKLLELRYNPLSFIRLTPKIQLLHTEDLHLNINKLLQQNNSTTSSKTLNFQVEKIMLNNTKILYKDKDINFTTNIDSFQFNNHIKVKNISLDNLTLKDTNTSIKLNLKARNIDFKTILKIENLKANSTMSNLDYGNYSLDINSTNILYKTKQTDIENFDFLLKTPYGELLSKNAHLKQNSLFASTKVTPDKNISNIYTGFIDGIPRVLDIDLNVSMSKIDMKTHLNKVTLKKDQNLSLEQTSLHVKYFIQSNYFEANTNYNLLYDKFKAHMKQKASFTTDLKFQSTAKMDIIKTPINLPTKTIDILLSGDSSFMIAELTSSNIKLLAKTYDYKQYSLRSETKKLPLSFIDKIPESLKDDLLTSNGNLVLDINPLFLRGELKIEDNFLNTTNHLEIKDHSILIKGDIKPKKDANIYDTFNLNLLSNLNFVYFKNKEQDLLNLDSDKINITIFENNNTLKGWGNLNENSFNISGNLAKQGQNNLKLFATFPSIKTLFSELKIKIPKTEIQYDAQVNVNANIDFNNKLKLNTTIEVPWFYMQPNKQTTYAGQNAIFNIERHNNKFIINDYKLEIMGHKINSLKPSIISLDQNNSINIKKFWVYDNLLINGVISTSQNSIKLKIKSDDFTYSSNDGNVSVNTDITINIDKKQESIEGTITLLDGTITYLPKKDYSKLDSDIIIIQDINEKVINNRFINIHINSKKPINYKIDNIDIDFTPNFSIYKDAGSEKTTILGMVTINKGEVKVIDKSFKFKNSELYFYDINTNPKLNLNITHQTLDYIDINIYATGNLETPIIILSSKPTLSQNDIMSYILFGEPSMSSINTSSDSHSNKIYLGSLLAGGSIKSILNKSDNINIDTINILTNDEGSLGYEIGSRINKDLRVIYKNNIISSIIVQYNISRAIRVDVDVDQENRGISLIYVKDF